MSSGFSPVLSLSLSCNAALLEREGPESEALRDREGDTSSVNP